MDQHNKPAEEGKVYTDLVPDGNHKLGIAHENNREFVVYIAGPYDADTEYGVLQNIRHAERYALKWWKLGYTVICPHKNTAFFGGACPYEYWLEGDMELLMRSDIVVFIPGWEGNSGSRDEHEVALSFGKDIRYEEE